MSDLSQSPERGTRPQPKILEECDVVVDVGSQSPERGTRPQPSFNFLSL